MDCSSQTVLVLLLHGPTALRCNPHRAELTRSPVTPSMHMQTLEKEPLPSSRTSSYRSPSCSRHGGCARSAILVQVHQVEQRSQHLANTGSSCTNIR